MEQMAVTAFNLISNKEKVLRLIDCNPNDSSYNKIYEHLKSIAYNLIEPKAVIAFGSISDNLNLKYLEDCSHIIYVIKTVGSKISDKSTEFFKSYKYLEGMMLNTIADDFLFNMEDTLLPLIKLNCKKRGLGVKKRLEPSLLEVQETIWKETSAKELIGIDMTESFMLNPVKSNTFILGADSCIDNLDLVHNCSSCENFDCNIRKPENIEIKIHLKTKIKIISKPANKNLMHTLKENDIELPFICSGRGSCGKCGIQLLSGYLPITPSDQNFYSTDELENGWRLACQAYPCEDIEINCVVEKSMQVLSKYENINKPTLKHLSNGYGVAIDIGTTTIALELINMSSGNSIKDYTLINGQRVYGVDVISRIESSIKGNGEILRKTVQTDILKGLVMLDTRVKIEKIVIAANTTMIHLLMGFNCESLGVFPFIPITLQKLEYKYDKLFGFDLFKSDITVLPGISTFIGADIVSGMLMCGFDKETSIVMLIDIGTNGEMVIGNKDKILCTSTAAGPALEGGNISCGIGSVQGAISKIRINSNKIKYDTIGNVPPIGICGSGVIDITAEALKNKLIDKTGLLSNELFDTGIEIAVTPDGRTIKFTQKDFREIQLAKAAIRAGIEILIRKYGCNYKDITTIYIAGGFGYHININNAITIGLIPKSFKSKIKMIGNSSLGGARHYLLDNKGDEEIKDILNVSKEIYLADNSDFNELYMESMYFE